MGQMCYLLEMNLILPSIHGDPAQPETLESWTHRFLAVEMSSTFVATSDDVDIAGKVFRGDPELRTFFQSGEAAYIYLKHLLFPFMAKNSREQCYDFLDKPPARLCEATLKFVCKMANGGINDYVAAGKCDAEGGADALRTISDEESILREFHGTWAKPHQ